MDSHGLLPSINNYCVLVLRIYFPILFKSPKCSKKQIRSDSTAARRIPQASLLIEIGYQPLKLFQKKQNHSNGLLQETYHSIVIKKSCGNVHISMLK